MSSKTNEVSLKAFDVKNLPLGTTQLGFNQKVDEGFTKVEDAIDQAIADLGNHKTVIDAIVDVADGAATKAQQGVDNAATAQSTANAAKQKAETNATAIEGVKAAYVEADTKLKTDIETAYQEADDGLTNRIDGVVAENSKDLIYSNPTPIVEGIGSVEVGETFSKVPISKMLDKILYPYVAPTIYATVEPESKTVEKGDTITVTNLVANVGKKSEDITKVEYLSNDVSKESKVEGVAAGGAIKFTTPIEIKVNTTLKVRATDGKTPVTATAASYSFIYPSYYGVVSSATPNASTIKGLTSKLLHKDTQSIPYTTNNNYACYAFPASYKKLVQILDPNGFDVTPTFDCQELSVACKDGTSQKYNVYTTSKASTVSEFTYTFGFSKLK